MQMQKVKQELTFWHPRTHLQELFVDFLCKLVVNCHLQQAIRIDMKKESPKFSVTRFITVLVWKSGVARSVLKPR